METQKGPAQRPGPFVFLHLQAFYWQLVTACVTRFKLQVLPLTLRTTLPCASAGKSTSIVRTTSRDPLCVPRVTAMCTESTRTMEPETGHGFEDLGKFHVSALTVSCAASAATRVTSPSVKVVVSCAAPTAPCARDVSTGGWAVLKIRRSVSLAVRCATPVQV